jgi:hypothetical protein
MSVKSILIPYRKYQLLLENSKTQGKGSDEKKYTVINGNDPYRYSDSSQTLESSSPDTSVISKQASHIADENLSATAPNPRSEGRETGWTNLWQSI